MDTNLKEAVEEFITHRVNYHGGNLSKGASGAFDGYDRRIKELAETLTEPQKELLLEIETAHSYAFGEVQRFYYECGFKDARDFLLCWGSGQ